MFILHQLLTELKNAFAYSQKGKERGVWFVYTFMASSNLPFFIAIILRPTI